MGRTRIIVVLAIAAIGAIGLALIVGAMTKHKPAPAQVVISSSAPAQPMARVLVAKHDLGIGTRLGANDLTWQDWPADAVNPAFITDGQGARVPVAGGAAAVIADQAKQTAHAAAQVVAGATGPMEQLYGSIVRQPILANEPITNTKLVRGGEGGFMAVVLRPGMRAVAVQVNTNTAAGGFILPGDRVDVVQSRPADSASNGGRPGFVADTLLRNIRVLAIDQNSQPPKNGVQSQVGSTATLEVAAADTEVIARAKAQGEVILALRAYSDAGGPSGRGAAGAEDSGTVHIFRSGQAPEVMVLQ
jgi:pilus assembly protein CpaB